MTPIEARQWTLKEVIDFCEKEQSQYQGEPFLEDGEFRQYFDPEYFALEAVKSECERLMNAIKIAA